MLILTRYAGQSIIIADDIQVLVIATRNGQVRLGIDAPEGITVHREEIYLKILQERLEKLNNV